MPSALHQSVERLPWRTSSNVPEKIELFFFHVFRSPTKSKKNCFFFLQFFLRFWKKRFSITTHLSSKVSLTCGHFVWSGHFENLFSRGGGVVIISLAGRYSFNLRIAKSLRCAYTCIFKMANLLLLLLVGTACTERVRPRVFHPSSRFSRRPTIWMCTTTRRLYWNTRITWWTSGNSTARSIPTGCPISWTFSPGVCPSSAKKVN